MDELFALVEAARTGDSKAYAALIQHFQGMAYATAYRYVGDHHLAQDLVQDAIIEAFLHLPQLKEPAAFPGWFRQIVFRQCTRVLRQANIPCTSLETVSKELLSASNPEELAVRSEQQACVRSAVASLPAHEQQVIVLFHSCHYSYNQMSTLLKVPLTTVKKRLYSARQHLKERLQAILGDENALAPRNSEEIAEIVARLLACWINEIKQSMKGRNVFGCIFSTLRVTESCRTVGRSAYCYGSRAGFS